MTLKDFIENLKKFVEENPETLEMQVITSQDDEGNSFSQVFFSLDKGIFEDGNFISFDYYEDEGREDSDTNAVCIC